MFDAIKQGAPSISIHVPLRGGRPSGQYWVIRGTGISIHVPLRGGRLRGRRFYRLHARISIHVPLRGGRLIYTSITLDSKRFQSTSPYAGDDWRLLLSAGLLPYFNPRPPTRGTTQPMPSNAEDIINFNPRPPTRGTTIFRKDIENVKINFNPRPPTRGTTAFRGFETLHKLISIHVPLRGGRRFVVLCGYRPEIFQSTSPYAGDDSNQYAQHDKAHISIHVPLRGGRHATKKTGLAIALFQSTSPYAGDDVNGASLPRRIAYFNPRPPTRGTT